MQSDRCDYRASSVPPAHTVTQPCLNPGLIATDLERGRYGEPRLEVEKSTGESFTPDKLSDGTRDQLYLSIRVALGEKILEGNTGFFVMDDAFLTSDSSRLETQVDVVEKLAEQG